MPRKGRTPLSPPRVCGCGFITTDRRHWHEHHRDVDCEYYAKVLRDRARAHAQQAEDHRLWTQKQAILERSEWISETLQEMESHTDRTSIILGRIYDLIKDTKSE